MLKALFVALVLLVFTVPAVFAGVSLDEPDSYITTSSLSDTNCSKFIEYPDCQSCWFMCLQSLMMDAFMDAQWEDF